MPMQVMRHVTKNEGRAWLGRDPQGKRRDRRIALELDREVGVVLCAVHPTPPSSRIGRLDDIFRPFSCLPEG